MSYDPTKMTPEQVFAYKRGDQDAHRLATWEQLRDALQLAYLSLMEHSEDKNWTGRDEAAWIAVDKAIEAGKEE